jgi:hypothetical protein
MLKFDPLYKDDEEGFCAAYKRSDYAPDLREPWFKESQTTETTTPTTGAGGPGAEPAVTPKVQPTCTSKRKFTAWVRRPRGLKITRASALVDGKRVKVRRGKRIRVNVDLRGRKAGLAILRITVKGKKGGSKATYRWTRAYRTCK